MNHISKQHYNVTSVQERNVKERLCVPEITDSAVPDITDSTVPDITDSTVPDINESTIPTNY